MKITLTQSEINVLDRQDPSTANDGGYQSFLVQLQQKLNRTANSLDLDKSDLERIPRYAFEYGQGGWEERLKAIFERTLGMNLK